MRTEAVRLYGKEDLRLESFELPEIKDDEILFEVIVDSMCMSTYKIAIQGAEHKKIPNDINENPTIMGHEIAGNIVKLGKKWEGKFDLTKKYAIQPNIPQTEEYPGYALRYCGGNATYIILPSMMMEDGCLIPFSNKSYFEGALTEPLSCVLAGFKSNYHKIDQSHRHEYGIKKGGNVLILGGTGPMGLLAVDCAINNINTPKNVVITDIDEEKLTRASRLYPGNEHTQVHFVNTKDVEDQASLLMEVVAGKYDDVFVYVPVEQLVTVGDAVLNTDGCLNIFAGPSDKEFSARVNFYDVHYRNTHFAGVSGGTVEDYIESLKMIEEGTVDVSKVVTHVLGLEDTGRVIVDQVKIGGGKKLVYPHCKIPFTSLEELMTSDQPLAEILSKNDGLWNAEAENYVLEKLKK